MAAGESTASNIRRIAILVTSLDAVAARQFLLHMPTELAKQVRRAMANLGRIDPVEQQRILADFRRVAGDSSGVAAKFSPAGGSSDSPTYSTLLSKPPVSSSGQFKSDSPNATSRSPDSGQSTPSISNDSFASSNDNSTNKQSGWQSEYATDPSLERTWKKLNTDSLAHLLRGERAAVVAVVVSQLNPQLAVKLMDQLPPQQHRDILARLGRLGEIDEDAMLAIDEHLASKLKDYQHELTSTNESLLRMGGILSAAPTDLRHKWISELTREDPELAGRLGLQSLATMLESQMSGMNQFDAVRLDADLSTEPLATSSLPPSELETLAAMSVEPTVSQLEEFGRTVDDSEPTILPLASEHELTTNDRSLQAIEFEQLLELPLQLLAHVLNSVEADSILLALAGASPSFMDRFLGMLNRQDARDLQRRLRNIGPIHLRDVDEAQRRIIEFASNFEHQQATRSVRFGVQSRKTLVQAA